MVSPSSSSSSPSAPLLSPIEGEAEEEILVDADVDGGGKGEGISSSDIRYWNPWQPPDVTLMRSAMLGLLSAVRICVRRWVIERD
jgi:hypothetical protein